MLSSLKNSWLLIRRLPNLPVLMPLILLAGFVEGIGVSALVPMASTLTGDLSIDEMPAPFNIFPDILRTFGVEPTFGALLLLITLTMIGAFLFVHLQERVVAHTRYRFLEGLRNRASQVVFASRWEHLSDLSSGDLANQLLHESERGTEALIAMLNIFAFAVHLFIYAIFAWLLSWQMFLIAALTLLIATFTARRLIRAVRKLGENLVEVKTRYSRQLVDFIRGSKLLKVTATEKVATEQLRVSNQSSCVAARGIIINQSLMRFELQVIISIAMVGILYVAVEVLAIPVSIMLVFLFILIRLMPKFSTLQGQCHAYSAFHPALATVDEMIRTSDEMAEDNSSGKHLFTGVQNALSLQGVSYCYPNTKQNALSNITLDIKTKEFIAFVGRSGSGKSTILDMLMGLIEPTEGSFQVDQRPLDEFTRESYRSRIGFVPQESVFFTGTIRENLCFGGHYEDQELWHYMEIAQIADFVKGLPEQLDTEVGESGSKLSGGQRQRLSIARALVRKPALLVLDEATSALDSESERSFQEAIEAVAHEYTLIVVAHRLSTISAADRIYLLEDGNLVQQGDYQSLQQHDGAFAELNKIQNEHKQTEDLQK